MAKSINKFIVRLGNQTQYSPQLAVLVVPVADQKKTFEVRIVNPNTKEIVHKEEFKSTAKDDMSCFLEALSHGKKLLEKPDLKALQLTIPYIPQIFVAQGRRGKMKLKTKDSEEAILERKDAEEKALEEAEAAAELLEEDSDDGLPTFEAKDVDVDEESDDSMDDVSEAHDEDDAPVVKKKQKVNKNKVSTKTKKVKPKNKKKEVKTKPKAKNKKKK